MKVLFNNLTVLTTSASGNASATATQERPLVNTVLIGDAVVVTQAAPGLDARDAVATVLLDISKVLFDFNHPNRGVILKGHSIAQWTPGLLPYITGTGLIQANRIEKNLKVAGLVIDPSVEEDAKSWKCLHHGQKLLFTQRMEGRMFLSCSDHHKLWKKYVEKTYLTHPYLAAAKVLIDDRDNWTEGQVSVGPW